MSYTLRYGASPPGLLSHVPVGRESSDLIVPRIEDARRLAALLEIPLWVIMHNGAVVEFSDEFSRQLSLFKPYPRNDWAIFHEGCQLLGGARATWTGASVFPAFRATYAIYPRWDNYMTAVSVHLEEQQGGAWRTLLSIPGRELVTASGQLLLSRLAANRTELAKRLASVRPYNPLQVVRSDLAPVLAALGDAQSSPRSAILVPTGKGWGPGGANGKKLGQMIGQLLTPEQRALQKAFLKKPGEAALNALYAGGCICGCRGSFAHVEEIVSHDEGRRIELRGLLAKLKRNGVNCDCGFLKAGYLGYLANRAKSEGAGYAHGREHLIVAPHPSHKGRYIHLHATRFASLERQIEAARLLSQVGGANYRVKRVMNPRADTWDMQLADVPQ